MKRLIWLLALAALVALALPCLAETYYVQTEGDLAVGIRDAATDAVLGYIPSGTALEPDPDKSTELSAYVTYEGKSGFVPWRYLTMAEDEKGAENAGDKDNAPIVEEVILDDAPEATPAPAEDTTVPGSYTIRVVGGIIQRANAKNKAAGEQFESLEVTEEDNIVITAQIPRGRKVDYWVINGIQYDFDRKVSSIRLTHADRDWTFEIVYTRSDAQTLLTAEQIQEARTGEQLVITAVNAQLCHIKKGTTGGGGWIESFDFTEDYTNRATNAQEQGGQVTAKVKATIPRGKKVSGWKFGETELYPNVQVTWLLPRMLNTSMTYEPIFSGASSATVTPGPTDPPTAVTRYYTVRCYNCTFSGGGYTNATSGTVAGGTTITLHANFSAVHSWYVNGTLKLRGRKATGYYNDQRVSFSAAINKDTTFECYQEIN